MPVAKKPRNKKQPTTQASSALPDRRVMESYLAAITGAKRDEAIERAQEMIYDAWEQRTSRSRVALARKALAISPLCADAYNLLAGEAASPAEAREFYERGLAAAELVLGREGFEEYAGQFWGFLETRPYMRARRGLAITLLQAGEEDAAIGHLRAMLELNPGDNQGIRYVLLATLLRRDEIEAAKTLLAAYEEDWSNEWLYTRAMLAFREGRAAEPATLKLVAEACSYNEHVPAMLAATTPPVPSETGFVTMGGPDEASDYVREFGQAWRTTPGAIAWLVEAAAKPSPRKRRQKKSA